MIMLQVLGKSYQSQRCAKSVKDLKAFDNYFVTVYPIKTQWNVFFSCWSVYVESHMGYM